jgi:hypothetical protein
MRTKTCLLLAAGLLAAIVPLRADDTYTIKIKKSGKGDVTAQDKQEIDHIKTKFVGPDGKVLQEQEQKIVTTQVYKETILEKEKGKKPTKLRRDYTKAVVKTGDKEKTLPYQGKTVLLEKKDGKYHFTIEGGEELTGADAALLNREYNKGGDDTDEGDILDTLFPKKAVKVGESWKLDPKALLKAFERDSKQPAPVDKDKITGKGKLVRAYQKDGKQFGLFDFDIEMPMKGEFPLGPGQKAPIQDGSKITLHVTADACIDGTASDAVAEMAMDMGLTATLKLPDGKEAKLNLNVQHKVKGDEKDLSKK